MTALSLIIPVHNEAKWLAGTIAAAREALNAAGIADHEIIVSDDASTDESARVARESGARVVASGKRNIGATRNVGASVATGQYLLFLDADSRFDAGVACELKTAMEQGAVGGGARIAWDEPVGWQGAAAIAGWNAISRIGRLAAGSFFFARRDAFEKVGGFDERYLISEEIWLALRLRRLGRMVILRAPITTSARKLTHYTTWELARTMLGALFSPWSATRRRKGLEMWYDRRY